MGVRSCYRSLLLVVCGLLTANFASAGTINVVIGTGVFSGVASTLAFDLIDGDGSVDNTVSITGFSSDAILDTAGSSGGVVGDLPGTVTFTDTDFLNELLVPVILGASIQFTIDYTNVPGDLPDTFAIFLLDNAALNSRVTTNLPGDALLQITLNGDAQPVVLASGIEPAVTVAVPEPSSLALLALAFSAITGLLTTRR